MTQHIELDPKREGNMIRYRVVDDRTGHEVESFHIDGSEFIAEARRRRVGLATVLATHHGLRAEEAPPQVAPVEPGERVTVPDHWHPQFNELPEHDHPLPEHSHAADPAIKELQAAVVSLTKEHRDNVQRIEVQLRDHSHRQPDLGIEGLREELAALQAGVLALRDRPLQTHSHTEFATLALVAETEARIMAALGALQQQLDGTTVAFGESSRIFAARLDRLDALPEAASKAEVDALRESVAQLLSAAPAPSEATDDGLLQLILGLGHHWHASGRKDAHGMQLRVWTCDCGAAILLPEGRRP